MTTSTITVAAASTQIVTSSVGERLALMTGPFGGRRPRRGDVLGIYTSPAGIRYAVRPR